MIPAIGSDVARPHPPPPSYETDGRGSGWFHSAEGGRDGKADCHYAGDARRCHRSRWRVGAARRGPRHLLVRAPGEVGWARTWKKDVRGVGRLLAESDGQVGGHGQRAAEVRRLEDPLRGSRVERDGPRG